MNIINKITGRNITTEYLGLMSGIITNDEFEMITMTPTKQSYTLRVDGILVNVFYQLNKMTTFIQCKYECQMII